MTTLAQLRAKHLSAGRLIAGLAAAVVLTTATSVAAQQTYPAAVEEHCADDYFRHCSVYALGSDQLRRCMEAKGRDLSPNCQQALKAAGLVKNTRWDRKSN